MGDVINIGGNVRTEPKSVDVRASGPETSLAKRSWRATNLRKAIEQGERLYGDEHLVVARNLDAIIMQAERLPGFNIHRVLESPGINLAGNGETDSTKRLREYRLPKGASEARIADIRKKPGKYFEIAKAISAETGQHEAVLICQLFEGCDFGSDLAPSQDWEDENWTQFTHNLKAMVESVIQKHDQEEYWRKVRAMHGLWDVRQGVFRKSMNSLGLILFGYGLSPVSTYGTSDLTL